MRTKSVPLGMMAMSTFALLASVPAQADEPVNLQLSDAQPTVPPQADSPLLAAQNSGGDDAGGGIVDYFKNWFTRVEEAQATQPHWMTPLVTVTPRLEQEFRYDQYWEFRDNGSKLDISDSGKGLELIPTETNELLINPPAWQEKRAVAHPVAGWVDDQFLVVKQRFISANEEQGNYIVTGFLGITAPSGNKNFTNGAWIVTPTIAGGMGWGDFDIQATSGVALPFKNQSTLGTSIATNIAFQYHLFEYFWPELEVNHTYWVNGNERGGKNQIFLTPGLILGRFVIHDRIKMIIGGGFQFAVTPKYVDTTEQTPAYNHSTILTARLSF